VRRSTAVARDRPSLVILDILMPELDGTAVCRRLRATSDVPVIFLTSKDEEMDRILGWNSGRTDYVVKPSVRASCVARVNAVLRRKAGTFHARRRQTRARQARHRLESHTAAWDGTEVSLTATEFALLKAIVPSPRRRASRART